MLQGSAGSLARAKGLRKTMSPPEIVLWMALRKKPGGLKFRRQHPSGPYVADFYCHAARLIIEIDGAAHDFGDRPARDIMRDRWFASRNLHVMRIPAVEVVRDIDAALYGIVALATARLDQE